MKRPIKL